MQSLKEDLNKLFESMADQDGNVHVMASVFIDEIMTVIEDRATKAYSDFIG